MTASVQLQDVTFGYRPTRPVLRQISLTVEPGTFLAIVGPNGAGKSTLVNLLAGLLKPLSGTIAIAGADLRSYKPSQLAQRVALVRQEFIPAFGFSVAETVVMARTLHFGQAGFESQTDRAIADEAMELTDTHQFAARPLASLSGGERQRVFLARALAQDTPILLLDEPTSFLDLRHQVAIYDLLKSVQQVKGRTVIAVTHDLNLAAQYCDRVLLLGSSPTDSAPATPCYRTGLPGEVLTPAGIEQAFGIRVFSASVGHQNVILPLGRLAKDANRADPRGTPLPE
jgi:iron complex transport system ATP-binding protein